MNLNLFFLLFYDRDPQAKNYYYKQLRKNFLDYPIMYPDDRCFLIAAYSLIAEGYDNHNDFDPRLFFPAWVSLRKTRVLGSEREGLQ